MKLPLNTTNAILYPNLSYREFFTTYNPYIDGQAFIATYGFYPSNFDFWAKLEPLSVLYIHQKHKQDALNFLRRFPLFEIYVVNELHTKAVFFYDSGRLLLGSENLCMPESRYSELMIEIKVAQEQKDQVVNMAFRSLKGEILTCQYGLPDIRLDQEGYPYLPCQKEVTYWDLLVNRITVGGKAPEQEYNQPSYLYFLLEYEVNNRTHILAFNRGYAYCGDISINCFKWLFENCGTKSSKRFPFSTASDLVDTSPRKDFFLKYHPIASKHKAKTAYWLGKVHSIREHQELIEPIKLKDITHRKIRSPK